LQRLAELSPQALAALGTEVKRKLAENRLADFAPYPKQLEFYEATANPKLREFLLMAANQVGKTLAAAYMTAMHLTGKYPAWWQGALFDEPVTGWAASETSQGTRDTVQRLLLGPPGSWGTGAIPKADILEIKRASHGVADAVETILVRHSSGGISRITLKTYDQGRLRWQGETLDFVWFDEEPPEDIYIEGLTRTNATDGIVWITFTPLLGASNVVRRFLDNKTPGTHVTKMTIEDAAHYTPEQRKAIIASYPLHQRAARAMGVPMLGSGAIFPVDEESIRVHPFKIPDYWVQIGGLDFGWDHPTAAVKLAWDRDADIIYVTADYRQAEATPLIHAGALKPWGNWLPFAWPHDGLQHDKGSGEALADQYRKQGLKMLKEKATHPPEKGEPEGSGGNGVEAGLVEMLERMQTGRWKVFSTCQHWFEEFRQYHREDGKIVKERDDTISASRYAYMMRRHAAVKKAKAQEVLTEDAVLDPTMNY
jgi:phage terminase large subunit-like protein